MDYKTEDIDFYIKIFPQDVQEILQRLREFIKKNVPDSEESISYGMVVFKLLGKPLLYFGAYKNHIGFYSLPSGNEAFKTELSNYKTGKGSIQFPLNKEIPFTLIEKIVHFRIKEIQK